MVHQGGRLNVGSARIYYQAWLPASAPKAALLLVHGLGEHSGRYMHFVHRDMLWREKT